MWLFVLFVESMCSPLVLLQQKVADGARVAYRGGGLFAAAVDSRASTCNDAVHEFFDSIFPASCLAAQLTARGQGGIHSIERRLGSGRRLLLGAAGSADNATRKTDEPANQ